TYELLLDTGAESAVTVTWNGRRSAEGCPGDQRAAAAGTYRVSLSLAGEPLGPERGRVFTVGSPRRGARRAADGALEDGGLGEAGEPLAHGAGALGADAVDLLEVLGARREQLLQRSQVLHQRGDHRGRQPRDTREHPVPTRAQRVVERLAVRAADAQGPGDR